jgi:hypothetical protein
MQISRVSISYEDSENPTVEKQIEVQYWFPSHGDPIASNSVFNSQSEFVDSLLQNKEPTYYLKISLPMFQHPDIILVISHMYFRKKSFQSAYLKCMSRSSDYGLSTGEALSRISESELLGISMNTRLDATSQSQKNANSLIHTVSAACRSVPYCDEAAKESREKLFSMWYTFGPPAVFFTVSPGDECSFRI